MAWLRTDVLAGIGGAGGAALRGGVPMDGGPRGGPSESDVIKPACRPPCVDLEGSVVFAPACVIAGFAMDAFVN